MQSKISYDTIRACKKGDQDALKEILKHYEPLIVEASKRIVRTADGQRLVIVDEDLKAYIESELALKILTRYNLSRSPAK